MRVMLLMVALCLSTMPAGAVELDVALDVPCGAYLALGRSALANEVLDPIQSDLSSRSALGRGVLLSSCVLDGMTIHVCREHPTFTMRDVVGELGRLRAKHALPAVGQCGA